MVLADGEGELIRRGFRRPSVAGGRSLAQAPRSPTSTELPRITSRRRPAGFSWSSNPRGVPVATARFWPFCVRRGSGPGISGLLSGIEPLRHLRRDRPDGMPRLSRFRSGWPSTRAAAASRPRARARQAPARAPATPSPLVRLPGDAGRLRLLAADRGLEGRSGAELRRLGRFDLQRGAGGGVAPGARATLDHRELAKAGDRNVVAFLHRLGHRAQSRATALAASVRARPLSLATASISSVLFTASPRAALDDVLEPNSALVGVGKGYVARR